MQKLKTLFFWKFLSIFLIIYVLILFLCKILIENYFPFSINFIGLIVMGLFMGIISAYYIKPIEGGSEK